MGETGGAEDAKRPSTDEWGQLHRQIEAKALRKLRHPSRSKQLKSFIEN